MQHNRKRAELHRLQEKHPEVAARMQARGLDAVDDEDESSSSEEEVCFQMLRNFLFPGIAGHVTIQTDSPSGASL